MRDLESAARIRDQILSNRWEPAHVRAVFMSVPPAERDGWVDAVLGLGAPPEDGPELPRGCVPYLPCSVDALLRFVEHAPVGGDDVFVDIGSGCGRAAILVHLLTGARAVGIEIQTALVVAAQAVAAQLRLSAVSFVTGDAVLQHSVLGAGTVFFLYCPFSGERLVKMLAQLESVARARPIRIGCVDLPLPPCRWLTLMPPPAGDLAIYRSEPPE